MIAFYYYFLVIEIISSKFFSNFSKQEMKYNLLWQQIDTNDENFFTVLYFQILGEYSFGSHGIFNVDYRVKKIH